MTQLTSDAACREPGLVRIVAVVLPKLSEVTQQKSARSNAQGSGHGVYSVVALVRLACMFVAGGFVFAPIVRYN
jgi:hypothetical protein